MTEWKAACEFTQAAFFVASHSSEHAADGIDRFRLPGSRTQENRFAGGQQVDEHFR